MENQSDQPEVIRQQMEETRTSLTEKIEALESQVVDTVQTATEAVSETVENVKETVETVTENIQETAHNVIKTLSIPHHARHHPWIVFGGAVGVGGLVGWLTGGHSSAVAEESRKPRSLTHGNGKHHPKTTNGAGHKPSPARPLETSPQSSQPAQPGFLEEQLGHLKGLALSVLFGVVRDLATRTLPEALGKHIHDEIDRVTRDMGGEPFSGPVFPETKPEEHGAKTNYPAPAASAPLGESRFSKGMLP
jgi:ElaB/YqjD/DUF883 family membrane-anchored ribosome-binding protein